jgi:hypothetical protein
MYPGVKDAGEVIIRSNEGYESAIGGSRGLDPVEKPVLRDTRGHDESRLPVKAVSHRGTGCNMNPPSLTVSSPFVVLPIRQHMSSHVLERLRATDGLAER